MGKKKERVANRVLYSRGSDASSLRYYPLLCTCMEERYFIVRNFQFYGKGIIDYSNNAGEVLYTMIVQFSRTDTSYTGLLYDRSCDHFVCEMVFVNDVIVSEKILPAEGTAYCCLDLEDGSRWETQGDLLSIGCYGELYSDENDLIYSGCCSRGRRHGFGCSLYRDIPGCVVECSGFWVDDKKYGPFDIYDRNGSYVHTVVYLNGIEITDNGIVDDDDITFYSCSRDISIKPGSATMISKINLSFFGQLERLLIGSNSFTSVNSFCIKQMPSLKELIIGSGCFSTIDSFSDNDLQHVNQALIGRNHRQFIVTDCPQLSLVLVRNHSFLLYQRVVIEKLPQLEQLLLGEKSQESDGFSFLYTAQLTLESLPALEVLRFGSYSFLYCRELSIINCVSLRQIMFGEYSFVNKKNSKSKLLLRDLPLVSEICFGSGSFMNCQELCLENCASLCNPALIGIEDRCFYFLTRLIVCHIDPFVEAVFYKKRNVIPRITRHRYPVCNKQLKAHKMTHKLKQRINRKHITVSYYRVWKCQFRILKR